MTAFFFARKTQQSIKSGQTEAALIRKPTACVVCYTAESLDPHLQFSDMHPLVVMQIMTFSEGGRSVTFNGTMQPLREENGEMGCVCQDSGYNIRGCCVWMPSARSQCFLAAVSDTCLADLPLTLTKYY